MPEKLVVENFSLIRSCHYINENLDLDDICFVPQMTFSCHILNLVDILKELTRDNIKIFENYSRISIERIQLIERIENCIDLLFKNYIITTK